MPLHVMMSISSFMYLLPMLSRKEYWGGLRSCLMFLWLVTNSLYILSWRSSIPTHHTCISYISCIRTAWGIARCSRGQSRSVSYFAFLCQFWQAAHPFPHKIVKISLAFFCFKLVIISYAWIATEFSSIQSDIHTFLVKHEWFIWHAKIYVIFLSENRPAYF